MKRKVRLSFAALERELSSITSNQMLNILGGSTAPLPNGFCHFNMVSDMMYGSNSQASQVRDAMYDRFDRDSFTDTSWTSGGVTHTGQSYDGNLLDRYMRLSGFEAHNVDQPSLEQIQNGLAANGGKVGIFHNNHAYVVEEVKSDGQIVMRDSTNGGTKAIYASDIETAYFLSTSTSTGGDDPTPPEEITTPYEDITTPYEDITTPYHEITTPYSP